MTNYAFTPSTLALPAGKVVLYLVNATSAEGYKPGGILGVHNLSLREPSRGSLLSVVAVTPNVAPWQGGHPDDRRVACGHIPGDMRGR